jgi:hypothetical protein
MESSIAVLDEERATGRPVARNQRRSTAAGIERSEADANAAGDVQAGQRCQVL